MARTPTSTQRRTRLKAEPAPRTPDPIEIAMEAAARGAAADSPAQRLLIKQERLVGWQIASERAGYLIKVLTGLAGLAAAVLVGALVWNARNAEGLIIAPFSVPPEMAQRGVTGEALASQLADQLSRMSEVSRSNERQRRYSADRGQGISIEIPETGISLSQLEQWLREKLGRQVRVTGELMTQPDGSFALVARVGSTGLPVQAGSAADIAPMVVRTAEAVYGLEQPRSYIQYLTREGRIEEALVVSKRLIQSPDRTMQAIGWVTWANSMGRLEGDASAAFGHRRSRQIDRFAAPSATANLASIERGWGHAERAYRLTAETPELTRRARTLSPSARRGQGLLREMAVAWELDDNQAYLKAASGWALTNGEGNNAPLSEIRNNLIVALAATHDIEAARAEYEALKRTTGTDRPFLLREIAVRAEDWPAAAAACDAIAAVHAGLPDEGVMRFAWRAECAILHAYAGDVPKAERLIATTPMDCQPCITARATLAEMLGQRANADRWFASASRMAPSLPQADHQWGKVLLARGDHARALERMSEALRRSPRSPDAIALKGEALLAKGQAKGAADKFAQGAKLAPRWGRLHLKWGEALAAQGKADAAKAKFALAARLDLTAAERAELAQVSR